MEGLDQQYPRSTGRGLVLFGSNDPEELVNECVRQIGDPLSDPFKEEEFLVQCRGLGTWLQLKIAEKKRNFCPCSISFPGGSDLDDPERFFRGRARKEPVHKGRACLEDFWTLTRINASKFNQFSAFGGISRIDFRLGW